VRTPIVARLLAAGADPARLDVEHEDPEQRFERAADAIAAGELEALREMLDDEPDLVHARSPRPHRATLLHYCAANGTEDPRQRTPPNAPAIAQLLVDRGADPNAACKLYGGAEVMGLLLTSAIPRAAGVDGELAAVLARAGARIGTVDGQGPLVSAILHGAPRAAAALAAAGAPVDTLLAAAGLDRVAALDELVAGGADVNARFAGGATALHAAAATGAARAVDWLLAHGADPTLREERWGATPAGMATYYSHAAIAATLAAAAR
jgi:ankyrin repeat protein